MVSYSSAKVYLNDSLGYLILRFSLPHHQKGHRMMLDVISYFGNISSNKDSTEIVFSNPYNHSVVSLKKDIFSWRISGAYNMKLKGVEFIRNQNSEIINEEKRILQSIYVQDSLLNLHSGLYKLKPFPVTKKDMLHTTILLTNEKKYFLVIFGVVISKGIYIEKNGFLVLNEDKTGNIFNLKIIDIRETDIVSENGTSYKEGRFVLDTYSYSIPGVLRVSKFVND